MTQINIWLTILESKILFSFHFSSQYVLRYFENMNSSFPIKHQIMLITNNFRLRTQFTTYFSNLMECNLIFNP